MIDTVIYTYKSPLYKIYNVETNQKDWITKSIESARELGYYVELYTDNTEFGKDLNLDKIHYIHDNYHLWDSFKIYVLENRTDNNYILSDNDVVFKQKLPLNNYTDLYFDGTEIYNWDWAYKPTMNYLKKIKVFEEIPFWRYEQLPVYNVGILKINNIKLKQKYVYYWKKLHNLILPYIDDVDKTFITAVITQYLLTLLAGNCSSQHFTKNGSWPYNEYYNHYCGYLKVKESLIRPLI